jgi:hypothetical protein
MSIYSLNITKKRCVSLLDSAVFVTRSMLGFTNGGLKRRMTLEEERARNEAREETVDEIWSAVYLGVCSR